MENFRGLDGSIQIEKKRFIAIKKVYEQFKKCEKKVNHYQNKLNKLETEKINLESKAKTLGTKKINRIIRVSNKQYTITFFYL